MKPKFSTTNKKKAKYPLNTKTAKNLIPYLKAYKFNIDDFEVINGRTIKFRNNVGIN